MATINLQKGQKIDLTKTNPGLTEIGVGLGWDVAAAATFDVDAAALAVDSTNKVLTNSTGEVTSVCYFNVLEVLGGSIKHTGDNRTGEGAGDDETIFVNLATVPAEVQKIVFTVCIFGATTSQNFGQVKNCFIRVYNKTTNEELLRYDLSEDYSVFQGINFGELYRNNGEWKFGAITYGYNGDLNAAIALLG